MKKELAIIIQARTGSKRFPNKVLKRINGMSVLEILIKRIIKSKISKKIIVTTTNNSEDIKIVKLCKKNKINFYTGSKNNLIKRFIDTSKHFGVKNFVQLTADNPLIDLSVLRKMISIFNKKKYVYVTNSQIRTFPIGMDIRIFDLSALKKVKQIQSNYPEHISYFFTKHFKKIKSYNLVASKKLHRPDLRLTIDYKEDFILIKKIISKVSNFHQLNLSKIISILDNNPEFKKINIKYDR